MTEQSIRRIAESDGVFLKGKTLYEHGRVTLDRKEQFWKGEVKAELTVENEWDMEAAGRESSRSAASCHVKITTRGGELRSISCTCQKKGGGLLCMHQVASLLYLEGAAKGGEQWHVRTSPAVRKMIDVYENHKISQIYASGMEEKVRLFPFVYMKDAQIRLELYLGVGKLYVVKNIFEFVSHVKEESLAAYGKGLEFYHTREAFAKEDRQFLDLVVDRAGEMEKRYGGEGTFRYSKSSPPPLRELPLSGRTLDGFFQIFMNRTIELDEGTGILHKVKICEGEPELKLTAVKKGRDGASLVLNERVRSFQGERFLYLYRKNAIYRCSEKFTRAAGPFFQAVREEEGEEGHPFLDINERDLPSFCRRVLPELSSCLEVEESGFSLEPFMGAPVGSCFYLDRDGQNVTLKLEHVYGDLRLNPLLEEEIPVHRDWAGELLVSQTVKRYFKHKDLSLGLFVILREEEEELYGLVSRGIYALQELGSVYISQAMGQIKIRPFPSLKFHVSGGGGRLNLHIDYGELSLMEMKEILAAYHRKAKYYRLKNGEFLELSDSSSLGAVFELSQGLSWGERDLKKRDQEVPASRAAYLDWVLFEKGERLSCTADDAFRNQVAALDGTRKYQGPLPEGFDAILRPYQKEGFYWMKTLDENGFGGILADDMGLGKTVQVIALLAEGKEREQKDKRKRKSLIVCPASLIYNWECECRRFAPQLAVVCVAGSAGERRRLIEDREGIDVWITSYDLLRRDRELYGEDDFDYCIIDEAQYIKNHTTKNARAVKSIPAKRRFALTGTPVENRLSELWSIFDFLMPGFLFSYPKFRENFEIPIQRGDDPGKLERLHRMIAPFLLRRLKKDVLKELPEKTETVVYTAMEGEQKRLYQANAQGLINTLTSLEGEDLEEDRFQILAKLTRLRQICCDPRLCYDNYRKESAKLETCMSIVLPAVEGGHQILIFSQFASMLELIGERLKGEKIDFVELTGQTKREQRGEAVRRFQEEKVPVFLISLKAGGTGLNLTAADIVIHYDPWWNVAAQNQATDRAYRIGQSQPVSVFKLITRKTVEESILQLQEEKNRLASQVIGGGQVSLSSLSREELLELLR